MRNILLEAIETFYDCVGDDFDYGAAIAAYSTIAEDSVLAIGEIRLLTGKIIIRGTHNIPDEAINGWQSAPEKCPQQEVLRRALSTIPVHIPVLRRTFVSDQDWQGSITYRRVAEPWGYHGDGTSIISKNIFKVVVCAFARGRGQAEMSDDTLMTMAFMNKHLERALSMQHRIARTEELLIQSRNVLDLIEFGVVLYGPDKKPVFVNTSAQRIFNDANGLEVNASGIEFPDDKTQQTFDQLLVGTYCNKVSLSERLGGMLTTPRFSERTAYTLTIAPLVGSVVATENVSAVVFIFDPRKKKTSARKVIAACYRLTTTEAELALSLMHGDKLEEVAQRRGVTYNTMKTHLHALFSKTNTNRQIDLVSLLLRSVSGLNLES